jgi:hypothetical protein
VRVHEAIYLDNVDVSLTNQPSNSPYFTPETGDEPGLGHGADRGSKAMKRHSDYVDLSSAQPFCSVARLIR